MAKKSDALSVAYFDHPDQVDEPGFYTVEDSTSEPSMSRVQEGVTEVVGQAEDGTDVYEVTSSENVGEVEVQHHSNPEIGQRVWPSPDGEGWVDSDPEEAEADGGGEE